MRYLDVTGQRKVLDLAKYVRRAAQEDDYATLVREPTTLLEHGVPLLVYKELGSTIDSAPLCAALERLDFKTDQRSSNLPTTSKTLGHQPRNTVRRDYCSTAAMAREYPQAHALLCRFAVAATAHYRADNPALHDKHQAIAQEHVLDEWRIEQTPFTSGIVNKNNPLLYHFDGGNDRDVWSCMFVFRQNVAGGYLAVPEFDLAFALPNNSLFMFDGQRILHGVTPLARRSRASYRYSVVFYSRRDMWNCLPLDQEVARIRQVRTQRERTPRSRAAIEAGHNKKQQEA